MVESTPVDSQSSSHATSGPASGVSDEARQDPAEAHEKGVVSAAPELSVDTSGARRRAAPLPIPPKSPRRARSVNSRASSAQSVPPVPSPSPQAEMLALAPSPQDIHIRTPSPFLSPVDRPVSTYSDESVSNIPLSRSPGQLDPTAGGSEASTSGTSPRRHRAHRTSMVPMRSSSQMSTSTLASVRSKESRRSRPSTATSDIPLARTQSGSNPLRASSFASDSNDTSTTDEEPTAQFSESSIPISSRRRSTLKTNQAGSLAFPRTSPTIRTARLPSDDRSPLASPSRSPRASLNGNWMFSASPPRSRPTTAGSPGDSSTRTSIRARTSQATSAAPFEYDASASESEEAKLERDFMAAIERRRRSNSPELRYTMRQSMPQTARSREFASSSVPDSGNYRSDGREEAEAAESRSSVGPAPPIGNSPPRGTTVLRGSRYISGRVQSDFEIPLSTVSPFEAGEDGGKSLIEEFQNRWSLPSADREHRSDSDSAGGSRADFMRRDSTDSNGMRSRRMGRVFSIDSDSGRSDLVTPRGSVSNQGAGGQTSSVYSTAGTLVEAYPGFSRQPLAAMPEESDISPTSKIRPMSSESKQSGTSAASSGRGYATPLTELPPGFNLTDSASQVPLTPGSQTGPPSSHGSLPPTPASEEYKGSLSSLTLDTDSESVDPVAEQQMSEADRMLRKREKTVDELIETERTFLQDMLLTRDVWLARARGTEMAEIMETLRSPAWLQSAQYAQAQDRLARRTSRLTSAGGSSGPPSGQSSARPSVDHTKSGDSIPTINLMSRGESQASHKSMKGFSNPFSPTDRSSSRLSQSAGPSTSSSSDGRRQDSLTGSLRLGSGRLRASISSAIAPTDRPLTPNHGSSLVAPMTSIDVRAIFSNLDDIVGFTQSFLNQLEECQAGSGKYGEAFLENIAKLDRVYSVYCSKFDAAMLRFETISPNLVGYNADCKELSQGLTNAWDLPSLLIKPVQRCLKYPLFIQSLLGCTGLEHPDRQSLEQASVRILRVAEGINELKRRHELVGKIVKPTRVRSDSYSGLRRGSSATAKGRSASSEVASVKSGRSLASRFKRSSSLKTMRTDPPPANDPAFDALLKKLDARHKAIYTFLPEAKAWAKAVRTMIVTLLQLTLVWKSVVMPLPEEDRNDGRSSRTIDYFASMIVKPIIEGPWHDLDQEIRGPLSDRVSQLLDLFRNPRAVIAKRNQKLADCQLPASVKQEKAAKDSAIAYHALNGQLIDELPAFLHAVETFFSSIVARFVALQTALQRVIADSWLQYAQQTCNQLGSLDQTSNQSLSAWWRLHKPIVEQMDTLKILASDKMLAKIDRARREALPATLRQRQPSIPGSIASNRSSNTPSDVPRHRSSERLRQSAQSSAELPPPIPRKQPNQGPAPEENRSSTFSASSANSYRSMTFTSRTGSSVTSPDTPSLEYLPALWLGATVAAYNPVTSKAAVPPMPYPFLECQAGDLFDVLDETQFDKYGLVRKQDDASQLGWLPLHVLAKVQ